MIVVCGGPVFETETPPDLSSRLRDAHKAGCAIAGICGGTVALARAGLLDRVAHTSNHPGYLEEFAPGYDGADHYIDRPRAVRDGAIITAPAPAPASFATEVLGAAHLEEAEAAVVETMLAAEHRWSASP